MMTIVIVNNHNSYDDDYSYIWSVLWYMDIWPLLLYLLQIEISYTANRQTDRHLLSKIRYHFCNDSFSKTTRTLSSPQLPVLVSQQEARLLTVVLCLDLRGNSKTSDNINVHVLPRCCCFFKNSFPSCFDAALPCGFVQDSVSSKKQQNIR